MAASNTNKAIVAGGAVAAIAGVYFVVWGGYSIAALLRKPPTFSGQSVAIDGLAYRPGAAVTAQLQRLSLEGANISAPEAVALFSPGQGAAGAREAFAKLTAEKVATPEVKLVIPGGELVLRDIVITHMQNGMASQLRIGGGDLSIKANGADLAAFKLGAMTFGDVDAGYAYAALRGAPVKGEPWRYGSLVWDGMRGEVTVPNAHGSERAEIEIGEVRAEAAYEGALPKRATAAFGGVRITPGSGMLTSSLSAIGLSSFDIKGDVKASYDWTARRMTLEDSTLAFDGLGSIKVKGVFGNIDKAMLSTEPEARNAATMAMTLESATVRFTNDGVVDKLLDLGAKLQGKSVEAVRTEALAVVSKATLGGGGRVQDGPVIAAFLANPKSLTVTLRPKAGAGAISLNQLGGQLRDAGRFDMEIRAND